MKPAIIEDTPRWVWLMLGLLAIELSVCKYLDYRFLVRDPEMYMRSKMDLRDGRYTIYDERWLNANKNLFRGGKSDVQRRRERYEPNKIH